MRAALRGLLQDALPACTRCPAHGSQRPWAWGRNRPLGLAKVVPPHSSHLQPTLKPRGQARQPAVGTFIPLTFILGADKCHREFSVCPEKRHRRMASRNHRFDQCWSAGSWGWEGTDSQCWPFSVVQMLTAMAHHWPRQKEAACPAPGGRASGSSQPAFHQQLKTGSREGCTWTVLTEVMRPSGQKATEL